MGKLSRIVKLLWPEEHCLLISFVLVCISQINKTSLPWGNWAHGYNINKGKDKIFPNNLRSILFQEKSYHRHGSIWEHFHSAWHAPGLFLDSSPYLQWNKSILQMMKWMWLALLFCSLFCYEGQAWLGMTSLAELQTLLNVFLVAWQWVSWIVGLLWNVMSRLCR